MAGATNLDVVRNPNLSSSPYLSRGEIHQTIGLTNTLAETDRAPFSLASEAPVRRFEIRVGKMSMPDTFDINSVGTDSHLQFTNWTIPCSPDRPLHPTPPHFARIRQASCPGVLEEGLDPLRSAQPWLPPPRFLMDDKSRRRSSCGCMELSAGNKLTINLEVILRAPTVGHYCDEGTEAGPPFFHLTVGDSERHLLTARLPNQCRLQVQPRGSLRPESSLKLTLTPRR